MRRAQRTALVAAALGILIGSCGGEPETQSQPASAPQAVPSTQATPPPEVLTLGVIARPVRGTVSPDNLKEWRLPDDSGLLPAHIHQDGPAMEAGLPAALYQRVCGWRLAEACHEIARRHDSGTGVPVDARRSRSLHRVACDLGSQESCGLVGSGASR